MQGVENVLLDQGVMGAIIVLLLIAVATLWVQHQKQTNNMLKDMYARNDALTDIIERTIAQEMELATKYAMHSREMHTTLTLLTGFIRELGEEREPAGSD